MIAHRSSVKLPRHLRRSRPRLEVELLEVRLVLHNLALTPLVQVSGASPFANSTADAGQPGVNYLNAEVEPSIAVNPTNTQNVATVWQQDPWSNGASRGIAAGISFDGGSTWQRVTIPGITKVSGGTFDRAVHTWPSFAPNGE